MSLTQSITARNAIDLLTEGIKFSATGTTGAITDLSVVTVASDKAAIVTGFTLTSNQATPFLVSLGLKKGSDPTLVFFQGYLSSSSPLVVTYESRNWYRGALDYDVVLTTTQQTAYTIDAKITSSPAALGYVEREGGQSPTGHTGRAILPPESGAERGQMEL